MFGITLHSLHCYLLQLSDIPVAEMSWISELRVIHCCTDKPQASFTWHYSSLPMCSNARNAGHGWDVLIQRKNGNVCWVHPLFHIRQSGLVWSIKKNIWLKSTMLASIFQSTIGVCCQLLNSSPPSAAYMRQWIRSALLQIMACCMFGAKPLSELMLGYCQLDPQEQSAVKFWPQCKIFHSR